MLKALLAGVSQNKIQDENSYCQNDLSVMKNALTDGLLCPSDAITVIGSNNEVIDKHTFSEAFNDFCDTVSKDDILIFYFTGHGTIIDGEHFLVLNGSFLSTKHLINSLSSKSAKECILILDCCYSGKVASDLSNSKEIENAINPLLTNGVRILASCDKYSKSFVTPEKTSAFTWLLAESICDKAIIRKGKKNLLDIVNLTKLYMVLYSEENERKSQQVIYQYIGTSDVYFEVEDYFVLPNPSFSKEFDEYTIIGLEPLHNVIESRYAVKIILKAPCDLNRLCDITNNIASYFSSLGSSFFADIYFMCFALDNIDVHHGNYFVRAVWCRDANNIIKWSKTARSVQVNNVNFIANDNFFYNKQHVKEHTADKDTYLGKIIPLISEMIKSSEQLIFKFNEFKNGDITEGNFLNSAKELSSKMDTIFFKSSNLDFAPPELYDYDAKALLVFGTAHDISLVYKDAETTNKSMEQHFTQLVKTYYEHLSSFKKVANIAL